MNRIITTYLLLIFFMILWGVQLQNVNELKAELESANRKQSSCLWIRDGMAEALEAMEKNCRCINTSAPLISHKGMTNDQNNS